MPGVLAEDAGAVQMSGRVLLDPAPFVDILTALKVRDGRTWRQIALATPLEVTYLTRLANGQRTPPSREVIVALAQTLTLDDVETTDLLMAAGWPVPAKGTRGVFVLKALTSRPIIKCGACGREWRSHATSVVPKCSVCEEREYRSRAKRIAGFEPRAIMVKGSALTEKVTLAVKREDLRLTVGTRRPCRHCRRAFTESEMVRVHLEGFYCRACQRKRLDRLCGGRSAL